MYLAVFVRTKHFLKLLVLYLETNPAAGMGWMFVDFIVMQRVNDFGTAILILLRPTKLIS
jgi:hypothetical protein